MRLSSPEILQHQPLVDLFSDNRPLVVVQICFFSHVGVDDWMYKV